MAFERMKDDLNIIAKLGDVPGSDDGLSPQELKALFDKASLLLQNFINYSLIPEIEKQNVGLPIGGGTMEGPINMNGQKLSGLNDPTEDNEAANKGYVDLRAYPVGAIYSSADSTSPASLFGGTWEQLKDRFLLGAGDTYAAGTTGGEATHKLTVAEMPNHAHEYGLQAYGTEIGTATVTGNASAATLNKATNAVGGNNAHNNMPPYVAVYMWKRVA